jgi:hypothetical protein
MTKYYCSICKRNHHRGKIYDEHLPFREQKSKNLEVNSDKIIEYNVNRLRPIAKRQLVTLLKKLRHSKKKELYIREINRLILHENQKF